MAGGSRIQPRAPNPWTSGALWIVIASVLLTLAANTRAAVGEMKRVERERDLEDHLRSVQARLVRSIVMETSAPAARAAILATGAQAAVRLDILLRDLSAARTGSRSRTAGPVPVLSVNLLLLALAALGLREAAGDLEGGAVTVSIGAAEQRSGERPQDLYARCQDSLRQAKREGGNRLPPSLAATNPATGTG